MWYPKFFHKESKRVQLPIELPMKYRITVPSNEGYPTIYTIDKKGFLFYKPLRCSIIFYPSLTKVLDAIEKDKLG